MRKTALVLCTALALACAVRADNTTIQLPSTVKGEPGDFITVKATTNGKIVRWYTPDKGLSVIPSELLRDPKTAIVYSKKPGKYRLLAYTAAGDEPSDLAECVVTIGEPPPGPDPGPQPGPEPGPVDPLVKKLQDAYNADSDPQKASLPAKLASLYRHGSDIAGSMSIATWDGLFSSMSKQASESGVAGKLSKVQAVIRDEVLSAFPTDRTKPLDQDGRVMAKVALMRAATLVEKIKP